MISIKLPRPKPKDRLMKQMLKTTHGKNGVPELPAIAECSTARHDAVRDDAYLFEAFVKDVKVQEDFDGEPLLLTGKCVGCGTTIARPPSEEARLRLEETPEETTARHARR